MTELQSNGQSLGTPPTVSPSRQLLRRLEELGQVGRNLLDVLRSTEDATPDAIDVTDAGLTAEVATQAEQERRIIELESRRLGIEAA